MRILFLGDIVGQPGVAMIKRALRPLVEREGIDFVGANGENASGGSGMSPSVYRELRAAGIDALTMGDHIYKRQEIIPTLEKEDCICKPANFPAEAPGKNFALASRDGTSVALVSVLGRMFMKPVDCPFQAVDRVLKDLEGKVRCILVDMHAEATGEKCLMAHHLKGRVAAVIGTHTHVPTADEQILPGGTAFLSDVGMTGPYDSVLGRRIDRVLQTTLTFIPSSFEVAQGDPRLSGVLIDVDPATGQAQAIRRVTVRESDLQSPGERGPLGP